jgi:hypothetical protein
LKNLRAHAQRKKKERLKRFAANPKQLRRVKLQSDEGK